MVNFNTRRGHKANNMAKSASKYIVAGLAGLAAGVAIGILIAPDKGSKTRKRLKKKLMEAEEALKEGTLEEKVENLKAVFFKEKEEGNND